MRFFAGDKSNLFNVIPRYNYARCADTQIELATKILKWFQFLNCDQGKENLKKELMQLHML